MVSGVVHHHLDHCSVHCCLDCLIKVDWRRGGCNHQTVFHSLLTKCFSLKSKSQSANWNRWMKPGLLVWQRPGPTHSRPPWIFIRMLLWIHSCLSWVGPPKWETNASLNLWRYMERCPGPVHLSANTDWRTPWMSSTIGGAMSVYCMLVAVNNGIVCWHCIRHIDIWSSAGLIRNISHFD